MKETVLHVRVDAELKSNAEELFESMGTSLSEAVRIFLKQCVLTQRFPFPIRSLAKKGDGAAFGFLDLYAKPASREDEREAWIASLARKR